MALTERLSILIDASAGGAIAEFKQVQGATKNLGAAAAGGTKSLNGLGKAGAAAGGMLKAGMVSGVGAAWAAIVGFGVSAVRSVQDLDAAILKFQRASGATTEEASFLIAALDDMGIEADTGSKAIFNLGKNLTMSADKLAGFGITAVKNKQGTTDMVATLMQVADAYVSTVEPGERATLAAAAFGKGVGQEMVPLLEKGGAGIKKFYADAEASGQIRTPEQVLQSENLRIAIDNLSDAGKEFSIMAGTALIPILTRIADTAASATSRVQSLGAKLTEGGIGATLWEGVREQFEFVFGAANDAALGITATERAMLDAATATDELTKAVFSAEDAFWGLADAKESLDDAERGLADATADYNKLLKEGAVDEEKVADARRGLAAATRSLHSAQREQGKAQKEYNEALAASKILGTDSSNDKLAEAADGLADANDSVASAQEAATEAARELKAAQAGDPEFQKKLADANERVSDATNSVGDATRALAKASYENEAAQKVETKAISDHADQVERLKTDLEALLALHPEQLALLGPIIGTLGGEGAPSGAPTLPGNGGLLGLPLGIPLGASGGSTATTTNNVTINTQTSEADARLIAKEVMWSLN